MIFYMFNIYIYVQSLQLCILWDVIKAIFCSIKLYKVFVYHAFLYQDVQLLKLDLAATFFKFTNQVF